MFPARVWSDALMYEMGFREMNRRKKMKEEQVFVPSPSSLTEMAQPTQAT